MPWRAPIAAAAIVLGLSALTATAVFAQQPTTLTIADVQGTGDATPLAGHVVTVRGVVTADLRGAASYDGLYLQSEKSAQIDGASDGIFVSLDGESPDVATGDLVEVVGTAAEADDQTEIVAESTTLLTADVGVPAATELGDSTTASDREALEGMLVAPVGDYTLASTDALANDGSMQIADATGSEFTIDDGYSIAPVSQPYLPADTLFTPGSAVTGAERPMVLGQTGDGYRLEPSLPVDSSSDDSYLPSFTLDGFVLGEPPQLPAP